MAETSKNFGVLLIYGQQHGLWANQLKCAEILGQDYEEFRGNIRRPATARAQETYEKLTALLREKSIDFETSDLDRALPTDIRGLYYMGARLGLWKTYQECGKSIGLSSATVSNYVEISEENATVTSRGRSQFTKAYEGIRSKVQAARKRMKAEHPEEQTTFTQPPVPDQTAVQSTNQVNESPLTERELQLVNAAVERILAKGSVVSTHEPLVRSSDWRDQLVSGDMEIADEQNNLSLRFMLRSPLIPEAPLLTEKELSDSKQLTEKIEKYLKLINILLQEQRRRLQIACQSKENRRQAVGKLLRPAKQMLGEAAATAVILQALQEVDLDGNLREYLDVFQRYFRLLFPPKIS